MELDNEIGKNDGSYGGIRYFSCKAKFGLFVPMHRVSLDSRHGERRKKKMTKTRDTPTITASLVGDVMSPVKGTSEIQVNSYCARAASAKWEA